MLDKKEGFYDEVYDIYNCDKEPIHRIRRIQSYGSIVHCSKDGQTIFTVSDDLLAIAANSTASGLLYKLTGESWPDCSSDSTTYLSGTGARAAICHTTEHGLLIEIEPSKAESDIHISDQSYQKAILAISSDSDIDAVCENVISEVFNMTAYDHIMVYRFDEEYNGRVIAEKKLDSLDSYLHLTFPASDIPPQARALYFKEKVRIIHDTSCSGTIIRPLSNDIDSNLDLSHTAIRGVSPIHLEYLQNMGVGASFSAAIIEDDRIWGLIACHNRTPRFVPYATRRWLEFFSDLISSNIQRILHQNKSASILNNKLLENQLKDSLLENNNLMSSLLDPSIDIKRLLNADGLIIRSGEQLELQGILPPKEIVDQLQKWIDNKGTFDFISFDAFSTELPTELHHQDMAGLFILQLSALSQDYIIWVRQEKVREVVWAGDPKLTKTFDPVKGRIMPRQSFTKWKETVRGQGRPWTLEDKAYAASVKGTVREFLYEKYNEVMLLNQELKESYAHLESFSYSVSHDLKAPLRSIEGFSQILKDEYGHLLDDQGRGLLEIISASIARMNAFIKEILVYSRLNKSDLDVTKIDLNEVIQIQWSTVTSAYDRNATLKFAGDLPPIYGELPMINQLIANLMSNAIKYTDTSTQPQITITGHPQEAHLEIRVEDNGIGIPVEQRERVFEVFRRLVSEDDYEGTGIGLSIVKTVIDRHGSKIVIEDSSHPDGGVAFVFSLPTRSEFMEVINTRQPEAL